VVPKAVKAFLFTPFVPDDRLHFLKSAVTGIKTVGTYERGNVRTTFYWNGEGFGAMTVLKSRMDSFKPVIIR
jgi:hypothetical protein